jgi:uncharacterized protein YlxP (DUF503 family)
MGMTVGLCTVSLRLPENHSLKGKRQVLKSLIARLHNRFNVSAAEVGDHDSWQMATLGVSCVSTDERHADQVMASVIAFIRSERLDAEIVDVETEVLHGIGD